MLGGNDRKKLKSKVIKIRGILTKGYEDYANSRFLLSIKDKSKRQIALEKNEIAIGEWKLIQSKLSHNGINLSEYIQERAYTFLNRSFFLFRMEALGITKVKLFKGLKSSSGWKEFNEFCRVLCEGEDEGYLFLFKQLTDFYSKELPGLFLDDLADRSFGIPGRILYEILQEWNDPEIENIFSDDSTAGWIYQYWNDPDREEINAKVQNKGKISGKEIASATQLFTERYMVEWLLQNSLGNLWLGICKKNNWNSSADTILKGLQEKRKKHNERIEKGEITEDTALSISETEENWKYYMEREIGEEEWINSPLSIREAKVLDPACGSGHFLIYSFELLFYFYKEEESIKKQIDPTYKEISDIEIAKSIIENNLFGVDLDPRAVQIAGAGIYMMARRFGYPEISRMNLVATRPAIGTGDKETIKEFLDDLNTETGIPPEIGKGLVEVLQKSDVLGSLLQIQLEIKTLLNDWGFFGDETKEEVIYEQLKKYLSGHDSSQDLGVFTLGNQLNRGLRLLKILEDKYDVVVANPPYLGAGKIEADVLKIYQNLYPLGKEDLLTIFMIRATSLVKERGFLSMITMHNWMFLSNFSKFREHYLDSFRLETLAHMGRGGGFTDYADFDKVMQTTMFIFTNQKPGEAFNSRFSRLNSYTNRDKQINLLNQTPKRMFSFDQKKFSDIEGSPMIYWWREEFREWYLKADKVGKNVRKGAETGNNERFIRFQYEVSSKNISIILQNSLESVNLS
ncbi:MAG: Eco57I restriction-modification methylase domain-containing protein, partial [Leptospiraceae bacterium]|nr:Eco57I restriction-modification methylase domain-containing protein [Leptospiraceae bacterium]